jgi:hypothetical protein
MAPISINFDHNFNLKVKRAVYGFLLIGILLLFAEEARFGYVLGVSDSLCRASGGKNDSSHGQCVTRLCYWFDDCGHWAHPSAWRDRVAVGDSIATVVFWVGEPYGVEGDTYSWVYGKGGKNGSFFSTTFRDGRFVKWDDHRN